MCTNGIQDESILTRGRYIGVLNVTWKPKKKKQSQKKLGANGSSQRDSHSKYDGSESGRRDEGEDSGAFGPPLPQVLLEQNRHIIPDNLFPFSNSAPSTSEFESSMNGRSTGVDVSGSSNGEASTVNSVSRGKHASWGTGATFSPADAYRLSARPMPAAGDR